MRDIGVLGETLAARYLVRSGCRILARNWRSGRLELDLVVREGPDIAFVEVKTRRFGPQAPEEAVDRRKRQRIRRAAGRWIAAHAEPCGEFRFDVIAVTLCPDGRARIRHYRHAFTGADA